RSTGVSTILSQAQRDDPEKGELLSALYEALAAKRALPSLRELRRFAIDNGLSAASDGASRDRAITALLGQLALCPVEGVRSIVKRVRITERETDRSLEGWTD